MRGLVEVSERGSLGSPWRELSAGGVPWDSRPIFPHLSPLANAAANVHQDQLSIMNVRSACAPSAELSVSRGESDLVVVEDCPAIEDVVVDGNFVEGSRQVELAHFGAGPDDERRVHLRARRSVVDR